MEQSPLTRRAFLKSGAAAIAAMTLAAMLPAPSGAATLVDPYRGVVPMAFPIRRGLYWIFNNWHVSRVGAILPYNHRLRAWLRAHDGIDIFAPRGSTLYACTSGTVVSYARPYNVYGNTVWIRDASGYLFFYCHLDRVYVSPGQRVNTSTVVGTLGKTGNAAGTPAHLHFELHYPAGNTYACARCSPGKAASAINPYASLRAATPRR
ncbi:MAG: M23 family metallopeptidase [Chloroflexi bacterium]|nr:M23 family metallopeptidase [Chloroflexota bacterium]